MPFGQQKVAIKVDISDTKMIQKVVFWTKKMSRSFFLDAIWTPFSYHIAT